MAKKRSKKKAGRAGKKAGRAAFKRAGSPKRAGKKNTETVKIHVVKPRGNQDVWQLQNALRKDKYFARVVGPNKVVTNSPYTT